MTDHDAWSSRALLPFTKGEALPYNVPTSDGGRIRVTEVRAREGIVIGSPMRRENYHLIDSLAAAWLPDRVAFGAIWLCGAVSIGARVYNSERLEEFYRPWFGDDGSTVDDQVCMACRAKRDGTDGPCVYRVWDKDRKRLLYIGSTKSWPARRRQHRSTTWWWQLAKHVDLEHFDTIAEARASEAQAIRAERPQMNVMHNRGSVTA
jgi:hypothetical protein